MSYLARHGLCFSPLRRSAAKPARTVRAHRGYDGSHLARALNVHDLDLRIAIIEREFAAEEAAMLPTPADVEAGRRHETLAFHNRARAMLARRLDFVADILDGTGE